MIKAILTFMIVISTAFCLQAQNTITARISDEENRALEGATGFLLTAKDSVLVKTAVSDNDGQLELDGIKPGDYRLRITMIGFKEYRSAAFSVSDGKPVNLGGIVLAAGSQSLQDVTIVAKKPFIERKLDRIVVNVENSIISAGSTVLDALERSPGVMVNQESSINLKGKQGVVVMIDGKPSPLAGADLINYLKSIPASSVEKIEIITNPSAKYDAAGNAGIINIKFKKDQRLGLNGNLNLGYGQGVYGKPSAGINLNYRNKKWNLFGNYAHSQPKGLTSFYINRKFYEGDALQSVFDQTTFTEHPFKTQVGKIGVDYNINKKTVIGIMTNAVRTRNAPDGRTQSVIRDADGGLQATSQTTNNSRDKRENAFFNFNFKQTLDSTGRELSLDADYGKFNSTTLQHFHSAFFDPSGQASYDTRLKNDQAGIITVRSVKSDYVHPLGNKAKVEAGLKSSFIKTDNDIKFFNVVGGDELLDPGQSNHFIYDEWINAAYGNYAREFKKTDVQLGLRMENTRTNGKQLSTGESFARKYTNFFPSFFVNQKLSEAHQLSFSYSRRIDRPGYRNLNPFRIFVDPYTYVVGDPALRPVLTNSFELAHTIKGRYTFTGSYARSQGVITDVFVQDDSTKISYQTPANLQTFKSYSLALNAPFSIKKWLNSSFQCNVYRNDYDSPFLGGILRNGSVSWDANLHNSFSLGRGWSAELSGYYQSQMAWGLFVIRELAQVSAGLQKVSKDKRSTFNLSMTDILYTNRVAVIVQYQNMDFHTDRHWDSQVVTCSYTYRFGKNTVAQARRRSSGVEEEKRRAG